MPRFLLIAFCLLLASATGASESLDPGPPRGGDLLGTQPAFLKVEQAYPLAVELRDGTLTLRWSISPGYYLYKERLRLAWRDPAAPALTPIAAALPTGEAYEDAYLGATEVYRGALEIALPASSERAYLLEVKSQGCADAGLCYPPRTQWFRVDPLAGTAIATEPAAATATVEGAVPAPAANPDTAAAPAELGKLAWMALLAALGGVILNLMPCVFPVLSLKVLSIAGKGGTVEGKARHGLVYTAGVVSSFVAVAALLIALRSAGAVIGWGFHLQSPVFVAALVYLFVVMGLGLSGMVNLGAGLMGTGDSLASQGGYRGSFFTGVLATVVASPCSAPFMGTALGFAMTQPPAYSLAIFASLGLGMAAPFMLLTLSPGLLRRLPRPGPWMDGFKQFIAFPLYAAAVWLLWVLGKQSGVNAMAAVTGGSVLIALGLWCWEHAALHARPAYLRALALAIGALALLLLNSPLLDARRGDEADADRNWERYAPARLAELRRAGTPVFVNLTADWCITCLANEKVALNSEPVTAALREQGIVYLKGDWTNSDPELTRLLQQHGRSGVPLYLFYPAGSATEPVVLPQLLTPDIVLSAIGTR